MTPADDLDHILGHTEELWKELRNERLFITGGTGFFGRWLLEPDRANDRLGVRTSAVVLTRDPAAFRRDAPELATNAAVTLHAGDLARFSFPDGEFSHVLHMGTTSSLATFNHEEPLAKFENIVHGTERTLDFAVQCRAREVSPHELGGRLRCPAGRGLTYSRGSPIGPEPTEPAFAVGHSKRAAEFLTAAYGQKHGFDATIARCFSFVGRHLPLDQHYAIGNFMRDALKGGPIEVRGDGTPRRSFLYAADLVIWLMTILGKGAPGRAYNVGSEDEVTIGDLANRVARLAPVPVEVHVAGLPPRFPRPDRYVPSTRRAQAELGLTQLISLDEAIARTLRSI